MSETRNLRNPEPGDVDAWQTAFEELELRMDAPYPFGGWPGQQDCRFEPPPTYDSEARPAPGR
jgi:hypothetical protein